VLVVTVVVVRVSVALSSDLVDRLSEDDVRLDEVVSEDSPHGVVAKGREEEELELLGELLESLGGGEESGDSGGSSEDGVVLLLGFPRRELPSNILFLVDLLDSSGESIKRSNKESSIEDGRRRQQRVVDLVQVTVNGLPVRVSGDDLGVKVKLERRRDELLLEVDPERLAVVGAELGVEGGGNGLVVGQLGSRQSLRESVVLQDLTQDELEDPLLLLLVILVVMSVTTTVVVIPLALLDIEEPVAVQLVYPQEVVERRAGFEGLDSLVERGEVGFVVVAVMRVGDTRVLRGEEGDAGITVIEDLLGHSTFDLNGLEEFRVPVLVIVQQLPDGQLVILVPS